MSSKKNRKSTKARKPKDGAARRPRVLVIEAPGGAATSAVMRAGAIPVRVNPRAVDAIDEALALNNFDALLLTGGGDVDPRLYGEKPAKQVYGVSETRDYVEWTALDHATAEGIPVMGICRGMQLICVHNGGSLRQHIEGHRGGKHEVEPEDGSAFGIVTNDPTACYPSLHHQVVRRHGKGLRVGARSPEGHIEAVEGGGKLRGGKGPRVLAVQFHPEYDYADNEASRRLFDWLAQAAAAHAGLDKPKRQRLTATRPLRSATQAPLPGFAGRTPVPSVKPPRHRAHPVNTRWVCRECGLLFDKQQDREDHEYWICGTPELRVAEPPPGHPDWVS